MVRRAAFNPDHSLHIQPANEPVPAVIDVDMSRLMVADKLLQNITAAPDFSHELNYFFAGRSRSGLGVKLVRSPASASIVNRKFHGTGTALNTFLMIASVVTACASAS